VLLVYKLSEREKETFIKCKNGSQVSCQSLTEDQLETALKKHFHQTAKEIFFKTPYTGNSSSDIQRSEE